MRNAAGDRFAELELNLAITAVPTDESGIPNLSITRHFQPELSDAELMTTLVCSAAAPPTWPTAFASYGIATG